METGSVLNGNTMSNSLLNSTFTTYKNNIDTAAIQCGLGKDITSKDKQKIFLKAGTPITERISDQIQQLKADGIIDEDNPDDCIEIVAPTRSEELVTSIMSTVEQNPVLTQFQLQQTLTTITAFISSGELPKKIVEHLTVFSKSNETEFSHTLSNLVFGTHIGKANNYNPTQLHELMSVLFFEDIGYARIDKSMPNAYKVHPLLSKEIVEYAGIDNTLILESIMQHEEKLDGSGYPKKLTEIHEYAQISQIANQYSRLVHQGDNPNSLLGKLFLLGQPFDFRTSDNKCPIYAPKLQKALIKIMQEKLKSPQQLKDYANNLHQELSNIIKWSNSEVSQNSEVLTIQQKIKSSLWVHQSSIDPFQVKQEELNDKQLCQEFITDAMNFMYLIVEPANYLNCVLHKPIEKNGSPISGETCLSIANPLMY